MFIGDSIGRHSSDSSQAPPEESPKGKEREIPESNSRPILLPPLTPLYLERGSRGPFIDLKQFCVLHGDSFLGESLSGGDPMCSLNYWCTLLKRWSLKEVGHFYTEEIDLKGLLEDYEQALACYKMLKRQRNDCALLSHFIIASLEKRGKCIIPIELELGEGLSGHILTAVFEEFYVQGERKIACRLLDRGAGMEFHSPAQEGHKRSLCSDRFIFTQDFFKPDSTDLNLLCKQIIYWGASQKPRDVPKHTREIYTLFSRMADEVLPLEATEIHDALASPSRSGICFERVPELIARIHLASDLRQRKRIMFAARFASLIDAYHDLDFQDASVRFAVSKALQGFAKFAILFEQDGIISQVERHEALQLLKYIEQDRLAPAKQAREKAVMLSGQIESLSTTVELKLPPSSEAALKPAALRPLPPLPQVHSIQPIHLKTTLGNWLFQIKEEESPFRALQFITHALKALPTPLPKNDAFWNAIPQKELEQCIEILAELGERAAELARYTAIQSECWSAEGLLIQESILTNATCIGAVHRMCLRLEYMHLEGWGMKFSFFAESSTPFAFFFLLGSDYQRFHEIKAYFTSLSDSKGHLFSMPDFQLDRLSHCLFYNIQDAVEGVLQAKKSDNLSLEESDNPHLEQHLKYIREALESNYLQNNTSPKTQNVVKLYAQTWAYNLPRPFYALQSLCLLGLDNCFYKNYELGALSITATEKSVNLSRDKPWKYSKPYARLSPDRMVAPGVKRRFLALAACKSFEDDWQGNKSDENSISSLHARPEQEFLEDRDLAKAYPWKDQAVLQEAVKWHHPNYAPIAVTSVLNWLHSNTSYLENVFIQQDVMVALFQGDNLFHTIHQEPQTANSLRQLVDLALERCSKTNPTAIPSKLFWLRLGYLLETYFDQWGIEKTEERIQALKEKTSAFYTELQAVSDADIYLYEASLLRVYMSGNASAWTEEESLICLQCWTRSALHAQKVDKSLTQKLNWLFFSTKQVIMQQERVLRPLLDQPDFATQAFLPAKEGAWRGTYPHYQCNDWTFNVSEGSILFLGGTLGQSWGSFFQWGDLVLIEKTCGLKKNEAAFFNSETGTLISENQKIHVIKKEQDGVIIRRKITLAEKEEQYELKEWPADDMWALFSAQKFDLWQCIEPQGDGHYLILDSTGAVFGKCLLSSDNNLKILRLDAHGQETGEILANPQDFNAHPKILELLNLFVVRQVPPTCCVWTRENRLSSLDLRGLNLEFRVCPEDNHRLLLVKPFGDSYFLDENQNLTQSFGLFRGFILKNRAGARKLILPAERFQPFVFWDYSCTVAQEKSLIFGHQVPKIYIFSLNDHKQLLHHPDPEAMLYLICCYALQGDYRTAKLYLDKLCSLQKYGQGAFQVLASFVIAHTNHEPERSSFMVHLALHVIENLQMVTKPSNSELTVDGGDWQKFWAEVCKHARYLVQSKALSNRNIPYNLEIKTAYIKKIDKFLNYKYGNFSYGATNEPEKLSHALRSTAAVSPKSPVDYQFCIYVRPKLFQSAMNSVFPTHFTIDASSLPKLKMRYSKFPKDFFVFYQLFKSAESEEQKKEAHAIFQNLYFSTTSNKTNPKADPYSHLLYILACVLAQPERFPVLDGVQEGSKDGKKFLYNLYLIAQQQHKVDAPGMLQTAKVQLTVKDLTLSTRNQDKGSSTPPSSPKPPKPDRKRTRIACPLPQTLKTWDFPLKHLAEQFFIVEAKKAGSGTHFPLSDPQLVPTRKLAHRHLEGLRTAHQESKTATFNSYEMTEGTQLETLECALQKQVAETTASTNHLRDAIVKNANFNLGEGVSAHALAQADEMQLMRFWNKRAPITFAMIWEAFLLQDSSLMCKHNPELSVTAIEQIFSDLSQYLILSANNDQAKQCLCKLEDLKRGGDGSQKEALIQEIGGILHQRRNYDPAEYPEFLIYEYASGNFLRPEQVVLLKWILNEQDAEKCNELLVEFQAGGGKTKVISVILMLRAIRKGKLPIFYSYPSLMDITKEDLRDALAKICECKLMPLELSISTQLAPIDLEDLMEQIVEWHAKGYALILIPESYHSLVLQYQMALQQANVQAASSLSAILHYLHRHQFAIIDEGHRNADALWQANFSMGNPLFLTPEEQDVFLHCYRFLTGQINETRKPVLSSGRRFDEALGLQQNAQGLATPEEIKEILHYLAEYLCSLPEYFVPETHFKDVVAYLSNKQVTMPLFIQELLSSSSSEDVKKAKALSHSRGLLTQILPITLRLVEGFDYGPSIRSTDEVESPYVQKNPQVAQFESMDIAAALCHQGLYQRGLSPLQMKTLITHLLDGHKLLKNTFAVTEMNLVFNQWNALSGNRIIWTLDHLDSSNHEQMETLARELGKCEPVVEYYLTNFLLPQIKVFTLKMTSTACDLVGGAAESILFSATLGEGAQYPDATPNSTAALKEDTAFQAAVISRTLNCPENQNLHWLTPTTPHALFVDLWRQERAVFTDLEGIINVGGWYLGCTNFDIAQEFLRFSEERALGFDGVVFIEDMPGADQQLKLLLASGKTVTLRGSNLEMALQDAGFDVKTLRLFKIYGPNQCTGTDLKLGTNAKMLLTFSETTTENALIQGIMRARQFLKPRSPSKAGSPMQRIVWVGSKKLKENIPHVEKGVEAVWMWALNKEAEQTEERIIARAFQQITYGVRQVILNELWMQNPDVQFAVYKKHTGAFEEHLTRDLITLYSAPEEDRPTSEVLMQFYRNFLKLANCDRQKFFKTQAVHKNILALIQQTAELVPFISQRPQAFSSSIGIGSQQEQSTSQNQNEEMSRNEVQLTARNLKRNDYSRPENYALNHLKLELLFEDSLHKQTPNELFGVQLFSPELHILYNVYTVKRGRIDIKPIHHILLLQDASSCYSVYALSCTDAVSYKQQVTQFEMQGGKVALLTARGILDSNGCGNYGFDSQEFKSIRSSTWFRSTLCQIAFLNGQVYDPEILETLLHTWISDQHRRNDFYRMWPIIVASQLYPQNVARQAFEVLIKKAEAIKN